MKSSMQHLQLWYSVLMLQLSLFEARGIVSTTVANTDQNHIGMSYEIIQFFRAAF